ncbi:MAG: hypothetical protein AAGK37_21345 [Pseudomonadota bacterium]
MALVLATVLFAAFVANVFYGATTGTTLLSDVNEMLLLFAASIAFVAAILRREAQAQDKEDQ